MTTEHKPDPEFVEYMENQVKNPHLSAATVMQMERVFIDQRDKYEAKLQAAREQEGGEVVYQLKSKFGGGWDDVSEDEYSCAHESYVRRALYTHPSQSQGVPEGHSLPGVGARHPEVVRWRNNAIEASAKIAAAYGYEEVAEDIRKLLTTPAAPQADEWVKCSDQLPKLGQRVKLFSGGVIQHYMPTLDEGDEGVFWDFEQDHNPLVDFRHDQWMPCPQPPEQGDGV